MSRHRRVLCALATTLVLPSRAAAQAPSPATPAVRDSAGCFEAHATSGAQRDSLRDTTRARGSSGVAPGAPAISLFASASAREVRFTSQPRIRVRLCGGILDSVKVLERRNLPDPVQPGVTYRDVYIAVEILGRLNAECLAGRVTGGLDSSGACAALRIRDTSGAGRRPPP